MSRRLPKAEEVFESSGGPSEADDDQGSDEDLFQKMHVALHSLMKNYEVGLAHTCADHRAQVCILP